MFKKFPEIFLEKSSMGSWRKLKKEMSAEIFTEIAVLTDGALEEILQQISQGSLEYFFQ